MDKLDKQEAMEKGVEPEMKIGDGDVRTGEDEEKDVGMVTVTTEEIEWKDKDRASATLLKLSPEMNTWECELIWRVIDDARKGPEEMDIEKLYASAKSIAEDNTKKDLLVAGGNKESMFALVMKRMMEMEAKERKRSAKKIAEELRNVKMRTLLGRNARRAEGKDRWITKGSNKAKQPRPAKKGGNADSRKRGGGNKGRGLANGPLRE
jgi:hypothetical protein